MNWSPPRPMLASRLALPAPANARILNSDRWNIGSGTRFSIQTNKREQDYPADQLREDHRARPSHRVRAVRLEPVGEADHEEHEADRKGEVPPDVQPRRCSRTGLAKRRVGPDRAEQSEGDADQEDEAPVDACEGPADEKPQERRERPGDDVEPERRPAL